jgi:hypothetical protein
MKRDDYEGKLARNESAMLRWTSKLKLASTKLAKLSSQRRRMIAAQLKREKAAMGTPFSRKFS